MRRREFLNTVGAVGAGSTLAGLAACESKVVATTDDLNALPDPSSELVTHATRILKQNLLKAGETFVIATPMVYDQDLLLAMLVAASEIKATGLHAAIISHPVPAASGGSRDRREVAPGYAVTAMHWDLYAQADLLITSSIGNIGLPSISSSYLLTVGDHEYRSDHEYINRAGSKTRWLSLGGNLGKRERYFPTADRRQRTLRGTILLDKAQGELRVTSDAGSDWTCSSKGRPGHAQYGIADVPGRWDNFGYGCVATGPVEDVGEGVLVLQPGDMIPSFTPRILDESITLTWSGGRVQKIEGGRRAREFEAMMASYNAPEAYHIGHFGWGTHENSEMLSDSDLGHYSHNVMGSLLFNIGMNYAHGIGGKEMGYSGLGMTTGIAPNHTHFTMFNCNMYVAGQQIIDRGNLSTAAGGIG